MILAARLRGLPPTPIAAALLITAFFGVTSAHAGVITLAWDPSPDPSVIGYRVHVGTTPGTYTETFDAGKALTFSYSGVDGQRYYFAVASYSGSSAIGPLSAAVSAVAGSSASSSGTDAASYWSSLWASGSTASQRRSLEFSSSRTAAAATCWKPDLVECVRVQTLARVTGRVSSLAPAPDGRLFFVEGANRLRQITSTGLAVQPLIVADASSTRLNQVAVDPSFLETGFIWVSETRSHTAPEGLRTFSVVRYRVVGNAVTERAAIVSGIVLPAMGDAVFAIDDSAHIYVAVPASLDAYDPYWGMVLRFTPDGLIPADSQTGSAVLTAGYLLPSAIAPEPSSNRVWLSGVAQQQALESRGGTPAGSYAALSVLGHSGHYDLLRVRGDGVLERVSAAHVNSSAALSLDPTVWGFPLAAAAGPGEQIYLALYTSSAFSPVSIVRLLPAN